MQSVKLWSSAIRRADPYAFGLVGNSVALDDVAVGAIVPLPRLVRLLRGVLPAVLVQKNATGGVGVDEVAGDPVVHEPSMATSRPVRAAHLYATTDNAVHRVDIAEPVVADRVVLDDVVFRPRPRAVPTPPELAIARLRRVTSVTKASTNTPLPHELYSRLFSITMSRYGASYSEPERKVLEPFTRHARVVEEPETMQFLTVMCSSDVWELALTEIPRPWLP